jgi:hypothetical protein
MFIKFLVLVQWKASLDRKGLGRRISIRTPHFKMSLTQHPPTAPQLEYIGQSGARKEIAQLFVLLRTKSLSRILHALKQEQTVRHDQYIHAVATPLNLRYANGSLARLGVSIGTRGQVGPLAKPAVRKFNVRNNFGQVVVRYKLQHGF